jgi:hypothetical protein
MAPGPRDLDAIDRIKKHQGEICKLMVCDAPTTDLPSAGPNWIVEIKWKDESSKSDNAPEVRHHLVRTKLVYPTDIHPAI